MSAPLRRSHQKRQKNRTRNRYLNVAPQDGSNVHQLDVVQQDDGTALTLFIVLNECHELVLGDYRRFIVLNAGRGFGKTQLILAKIWKHLEKEYTDAYGTPLKHKIWYIAPTYKQGKKIFWQRLKEFFSPLIQEKNESELRIVLNNGAEITIVGSEQYDNLRGPYLTMAIFDEFAFHVPDYWMRVIRPMLSRVCPLGEGFFCSTPDGHNEFYTLFQRGEDDKSPNWGSYHFTSEEGGFIPESEIEEAKREMTHEEWRQEYFGEFIAQANRVYSTFDRRVNCKAAAFVPGLDVHWFWDFNETPSCHSGLAHIHPLGKDGIPDKDSRVFVFDEICIGNSEAIANEFIKRYPKDRFYNPQTGRRGKIYIYGDVSGNRGTSGVTDYMVIEHILVHAGYPKPEICVTTINPFEKDRVNSVNVKMRNAAGEIGAVVNSKTCPKLANDFEQVKRNEEGKIDKKTDRKLTHISDGYGYMIYKLFPVDSPATRLMKARQGETKTGGYWVSSG